MLLVLNLPLISLWVKILKVPYRILMPLIIIFCLIGVYSIDNNIWDIVTMVIFGTLGYILRKFDYEEAPLMLGFILGPIFETAFRQSLIISNGQLSIFITRPISLLCLAVAAFLFISTGFSYYRKSKIRVTQ
jgi:putative tricarboxylic transport membrane protein